MHRGVEVPFGDATVGRVSDRIVDLTRAPMGATSQPRRTTEEIQFAALQAEIVTVAVRQYWDDLTTTQGEQVAKRDQRWGRIHNFDVGNATFVNGHQMEKFAKAHGLVTSDSIMDAALPLLQGRCADLRMLRPSKRRGSEVPVGRPRPKSEVVEVAPSFDTESASIPELVDKANETGDPQLMFLIGKRHAGDMPPNYKDAEKWYAHAAAKAHRAAQLSLAKLYVRGQISVKGGGSRSDAALKQLTQCGWSMEQAAQALGLPQNVQNFGQQVPPPARPSLGGGWNSQQTAQLSGAPGGWDRLSGGAPNSSGGVGGGWDSGPAAQAWGAARPQRPTPQQHPPPPLQQQQPPRSNISSGRDSLGCTAQVTPSMGLTMPPLSSSVQQPTPQQRHNPLSRLGSAGVAMPLGSGESSTGAVRARGAGGIPKKSGLTPRPAAASRAPVLTPRPTAVPEAVKQEQNKVPPVSVSRSFKDFKGAAKRPAVSVLSDEPSSKRSRDTPGAVMKLGTLAPKAQPKTQPKAQPKVQPKAQPKAQPKPALPAQGSVDLAGTDAERVAQQNANGHTKHDLKIKQSSQAKPTAMAAASQPRKLGVESVNRVKPKEGDKKTARKRRMLDDSDSAEDLAEGEEPADEGPAWPPGTIVWAKVGQPQNT
jgi:hypothetical protein